VAPLAAMSDVHPHAPVVAAAMAMAEIMIFFICWEIIVWKYRYF
jgi:hypothetical protein